MIVERSFDTGTFRLNYAEGPDSGPPVVLLHGLPGRWQEFMPILPTLITRWHIYAIDFRGQGKSGWVTGRYLAKYYAPDIEAFLQQQLDEAAILFGNSAGGMVALSAAASCPDLVRGVIVGDSPIDMDWLLSWMTSEGFQHYFSALRVIAGLDHSTAELAREIAEIAIQVPGGDAQIKYGDSPGVDAIHLQGLATTLKHMDPGVLEYHAEGRAHAFFEGFDFDEVLKRVNCPILLLQGNPALGGMMTDGAVNHVQSIVPDASHALIEEEGHDLGLDSWETAALLRAVTGFLEWV